jgi:hypothetical protein
MSRLLFPRRRPDGSFTIHATFSTSNLSQLPQIRLFVDSWIKANDPWSTQTPGFIPDDQLAFSQAYFGPPNMEIHDDGSRFTLVWEGRPQSTRWKDWLVYLAHDICDAFEGVAVEEIRSPATDVS